MKKILILFFVATIVCVSGIQSFAEGYDESLSNDVLDALPEDVKEYFASDHGKSTVSFQGIVSLGERLLSKALQSFLHLFVKLFGVLIVSAVAKKTSEALRAPKLIAELIPFLSLVTLLFTEITKSADLVNEYCLEIQSFMSVVTLSIGSALAMGGNVISASMMTGSVTAILLLLETVCFKFILPVVYLGLSSLISVYPQQNGMLFIGKIARSCFQWTMGIISFVSVTVLSYQTIVSHAEDSISASAFRYAISNSIPIVGGAVSESLRTVTTSVSLIRSSLGSLGVGAILVYSLFPIFSLLSFKLVLSVLEELSNHVSLEVEKTLLCETRKLVNMLISIVFMVAMLFIFVLSVFAVIPIARV